uniref:Uncharacterized protein n=1 Tax=Magallana gigas TaxID=29159 RepID=A0A8W8NJ65_MAGGI
MRWEVFSILCGWLCTFVGRRAYMGWRRVRTTEQQKRLRGATEDLRAATNIAASNALKKKLIRRLENAARRTASATTQLINASKNATPTKPRNID